MEPGVCRPMEPRVFRPGGQTLKHLAIALILTTFIVRAQTSPTGEIAGKVTAANGASISGVVVTVAGSALSNVRTIVTSATGEFSAPRLPAGTYSVWFQLAGFREAAREGVVVAGARVPLDVGLTPTGPGDFLILKPDHLQPGEVAVWIETTRGDICIAVDTVHAPVTAANFLRYVDGGFYTSGRFHRVTRPDNYTPTPPNRPAMAIIQGGINPARRREEFPAIPLERTSVTGLKHIVGTVSMARGTADTATSDFFICLDDQPSLDFGGKRFDDEQGAAAFGRVVRGLDVVRKIQQEPVQGQSLTPPVLIRHMQRSK